MGAAPVSAVDAPLDGPVAAAPAEPPPPARAAAHSAVRTGIFYSAAHYAAALVSSVAGFLVRLWVPAAAFGAGAVVSATQEYFRAYDVLFRNAIDREVPVHLARGDEQGARHVVSASYALLAGSLFVESLIMVGAALLTSDPVLRLAWLAYAGINVLDGVNQTDKIALKATQRFRSHNLAMVLGGLAGGVALIGLSWRFGTRGYFAGMGANALVLFLAYRLATRGRGMTPSLRGVPRAVIGRLIRIGGLMAGLKLVQQVLMTADRWLVVGHLGTRELGYYSLGIAVASRLYLLPQTLVGSFSPRMNGMLGTGKLDAARAAVAKLQRSAALVSAVSCGATAIAIGPLVDRFLPEYAPAVPAYHMLLLGTYFLAMNATSLQVHVGMERMVRAMGPAVLGVVVALGVGLASLRFGLVGIAAGRVVGMATYALLLDLSTRRLLGVRGMAASALGGAASLGVLIGLLEWAGVLAALAWLALYGAYSARAMTEMYGLRLRDLPRLLRGKGTPEPAAD